MIELARKQITGRKTALHASVAICTYKRPDMLSGVLETLELQNIGSDIEWEILLIDNDPGQSAEPEFERCAVKSHLDLRYIHEAEPGLSRARNRAISEARGEVIAFLDDDVLVPENWLREVLKAFECTGADCIGGRVLIHWEGRPEQVVKACERELVAFDIGETDLRMPGREVPIGANLAIRASAIRDQCHFLTQFGRTRANLMGCEEVELLLRLKKQGKSVWYSAASVVLHRTGGERLTGQYYRRREYFNGVSLASVDKLQNSWVYCHLKAWARLAQVLVSLQPRLLWAKLTGNQESHFLHACYRAKYLGYWLSVVGLAQRVK